MDELPYRQARIASSRSSQEFDRFIVGGGLTDSIYPLHALKISKLPLCRETISHQALAARAPSSFMEESDIYRKPS
ncbi:hypothetical protein PAMA_003323 [Pampus argenteus]